MTDDSSHPDDESEHSEVAYIVEQLGDGAARVLRTIETYPDGSAIQTEYEEDLPADDPFVLTRQRTAGDGPPRQILTTFLASTVRPRTYPAGFPFLPGRSSSITESPAHVTSPTASWRCDDPEVVLKALVDGCLAEHWTEGTPSSVAPFIQEHLAVAFRRDADMRIFYRIDLERGSVIQMMDLPGDWLPQE